MEACQQRYKSKTLEQAQYDVITCNKYQQNIPPTEKEEENHPLTNEMSVTAMNFWLCEFVIEVGYKDEHPVHQIHSSNLFWIAVVI